jgi:hypothetical protein
MDGRRPYDRDKENTEDTALKSITEGGDDMS